MNDGLDLGMILIGTVVVVALGGLTVAGWLGLSGRQTLNLMLFALGAAAVGLAVAGAARGYARNRAEAAEDAWAAEVEQVVRTERIEELGDAIGGLSAPTTRGEAGGLAIDPRRHADPSDGRD